MTVCFKCGDYGMPNGCTRCGKDSNNTIDLEPMKNVEEFVDKCEASDIPHKFIGIKWNKSLIEVDQERYVGNPSFNRFLTNCEKLHESFVNGNPLASSVYLFAPPRFGKEYLVYSCMQLAMNHGLTVAPYLDTIELKRLLILGGMRPEYKLYGKINYDGYMMADVVFVKITHTSYVKDSYSVLLELVSRRSRLNKPTYIISELTLKEITRYVDSYVAGAWTDVSSVGLNKLKYPAVIGFRPSKNL